MLATGPPAPADGSHNEGCVPPAGSDPSAPTGTRPQYYVIGRVTGTAEAGRKGWLVAKCRKACGTARALGTDRVFVPERQRLNAWNRGRDRPPWSGGLHRDVTVVPAFAPREPTRHNPQMRVPGAIVHRSGYVVHARAAILPMASSASSATARTPWMVNWGRAHESGAGAPVCSRAPVVVHP